MIASLEGRVAARGPQSLIVSVGGVGLRVLCTQPTLTAARVGEPILLFTHLVVPRRRTDAHRVHQR